MAPPLLQNLEASFSHGERADTAVTYNRPPLPFNGASASASASTAGLQLVAELAAVRRQAQEQRQQDAAKVDELLVELRQWRRGELHLQGANGPEATHGPISIRMAAQRDAEKAKEARASAERVQALESSQEVLAARLSESEAQRESAVRAVEQQARDSLAATAGPATGCRYSRWPCPSRRSVRCRRWRQRSTTSCRGCEEPGRTRG